MNRFILKLKYRLRKGFKRNITEEFTYTFTVEERHGLILRLDRLVKYLNQDLTLPREKREVFIETTQDLRKNIEFGYE